MQNQKHQNRQKNSKSQESSAISTRKSSMIPQPTERTIKQSSPYFSSSNDINVCIRIKPCQNPILQKVNSNQLIIQSPATLEEKLFQFDHIFEEECTSEQVYSKCCLPLVNSFMRQDCNGCILVYGQTGSGKTHTMGLLGVANDGVVPEVFKTIFSSINQKSPQKVGQYEITFGIQLQFIQIYLEKIQDLLNPGSNKKLIRRNGQSMVENVISVDVKNIDEALSIVNMGLKYRQTGKQNLNQNSSRSHTILTVYLNKYIEDLSSGEQQLVQNKLQLVDLAGSERTKKTLSKGIRMEEAKTINSSLAALGNVIQALSNHQQTFIPFRDSILTQLLEPSLTNESKLVMIGTIACNHDSAHESLSTLYFASRCKEVKFRPLIKQQSQQQETQNYYQEELRRIVAAFESRQKHQESKIQKLEELLSQKIDVNDRQYQGTNNNENPDVLQYLLKLLVKISQHASKLSIQNQQDIQQIHENTVAYLSSELSQRNYSEELFDQAHNIVTATQLLQELDQNYPQQPLPKELPYNYIEANQPLNQLIQQIQAVSSSLINQLNNFAQVSKNVEYLKRELLLHKFLSHQRDLELDRWMQAIGYLFKTCIHQMCKYDQQVDIKKYSKGLNDKIMNIINDGNFYQEMDHFKQRIFCYDENKLQNSLQDTLQKIRQYTNNSINITLKEQIPSEFIQKSTLRQNEIIDSIYKRELQIEQKNMYEQPLKEEAFINQFEESSELKTSILINSVHNQKQQQIKEYKQNEVYLAQKNEGAYRNNKTEEGGQKQQKDSQEQKKSQNKMKLQMAKDENKIALKVNRQSKSVQKARAPRQCNVDEINERKDDQEFSSSEMRNKSTVQMEIL